MEVAVPELEPDARFVGSPHAPGTHEFLACERGRMRLWVAGESFDLERGAVAAFEGDQRHSFLSRPQSLLTVLVHPDTKHSLLEAGKTTIMQNIANAITTNNPECHLMVVLVDELSSSGSTHAPAMVPTARSAGSRGSG